MYWEALMNDGSQKRKLFGDDWLKIDKTEVATLTLRETSAEHQLPLDLSAGFIKFPNLDMEAMQQRQTLPRISGHFDSGSNILWLDESSLKFLQAYMLKGAEFYPSFGILQNFDMQIYNRPMNMRMLLKTEKGVEELYKGVEIVERSVNFIQEAYSDCIFGTSKGRKQIDVFVGVTVEADIKFKKDGLDWRVQQKLKFTAQDRFIQLLYKIYSPIECPAAILTFETPEKSYSCNISLIPQAPSLLKSYVHSFNE